MKDSREYLLAVHCFCIYGSGALLGSLFGVSRSMDCEILHVLGFFWACFWCSINCILLGISLSCSSHLVFCILCLSVWFNCLYLPNDWLESSTNLWYGYCCGAIQSSSCLLLLLLLMTCLMVFFSGDYSKFCQVSHSVLLVLSIILVLAIILVAFSF